MKHLIATVVFKLSGWKLDAPQHLIDRARNTVMIAAPHTSNWDLVYSLGAFWLMRLPIRFFIKDFYTRWYFLGFFTWLGAIGVDRSKRGNLVDYAAELITNQKDLVILVPAEGTRKRVEKWKTGFYHIAQKSGKNISLGYLDYERKLAGILDVVEVGPMSETFDHIEKAYSTIKGKHPALYNSKIH
jgi:1-acyl-sn-glycerol-3-phosphate acyltransferase